MAPQQTSAHQAVRSLRADWLDLSAIFPRRSILRICRLSPSRWRGLEKTNASAAPNAFRPVPTDAIFGAAKRMHSIIEAECNGCDLCVEPCPVDCIDLIARNDEHQNSQRRAGGRP